MTPAERAVKNWPHRVNEEIWGKHNLSAINELITDDFIGHGSSSSAPVRGLDGVRAFVENMLAGFPDTAVTLKDIIAEGGPIRDARSGHGDPRGRVHGG